MKTFVTGLFLLVSSVASADTSIAGLITQDPNNSQYQIRENSNDQTFVVDVNLHPGSVCGQVRAFEGAMQQALGHQAQLTGQFKTLSTNEEVFSANSDGIQILESQNALLADKCSGLDETTCGQTRGCEYYWVPKTYYGYCRAD